MDATTFVIRAALALLVVLILLTAYLVMNSLSARKYFHDKKRYLNTNRPLWVKRLTSAEEPVDVPALRSSREVEWTIELFSSIANDISDPKILASMSELADELFSAHLETVLASSRSAARQYALSVIHQLEIKSLYARVDEYRPRTALEEHLKQDITHRALTAIAEQRH